MQKTVKRKVETRQPENFFAYAYGGPSSADPSAIVNHVHGASFPSMIYPSPRIPATLDVSAYLQSLASNIPSRPRSIRADEWSMVTFRSKLSKVIPKQFVTGDFLRSKFETIMECTEASPAASAFLLKADRVILACDGSLKVLFAAVWGRAVFLFPRKFLEFVDLRSGDMDVITPWVAYAAICGLASCRQ